MTGEPGEPGEKDRMQEAARKADERERAGREDPEPSLAKRFGQIGVLGWMTAGPAVGGVFLGGWIDRLLGTGIMFAAALTMVGAGLGLWLALRWMHEQ